MACAETDSCVFELVRDHVDEIVLVSDDDMLDACRWLWFELGIASDLSGAAAIAAVRTRKLTFAAGRSVAAVVCGAGPDGMD
jgi:threonine dehydratase